MANQLDNASFTQKLSSLSVVQQRQLAAQFIRNTLNLANEPALKNIADLAGRADITKSDLEEGYYQAHSIYVATNPHSGLTELNFDVQAKHFIAEACMTCLSPKNEGAQPCHLAQKVAMYCRMARTCASIAHEDEAPDFSLAEEAMRKTIEEQYAVLQTFLDSM